MQQVKGKGIKNATEIVRLHYFYRKEWNLLNQPLENNKIHRIESSADFLIKIMFRKNFNWQGEVHWLNSDIKRNFRSSLELLMLIHEAMEKAEVPRAEYELRNWDQEQGESVKGLEEENYLPLFKEKD